MAIPLLGLGALLGRTAVAGAARAAARSGISAGARMGLGRGAQAGIARGIKGGVRGLPRTAGRLGRDIIGGAIGDGGGFVGGATRGIQGLAGSMFGGGADQTIQPVTVNVVEGFASALKGTPPTATEGGGGGAIVPFGGSQLTSRESTAITKSGDAIVDRLDELKRILQRMLELEKESLEALRSQVLNFARSSEKEGRSKEQDEQEKAKRDSKSAEKNPIVKSATKAFGGIFDFIKNLVIKFVQYKILDWLSKPENKKLIEGTVQFFMNVVKLFQFMYDRFIGPFLKLTASLMGGGLNIFMDLIKVAVDFISLKWLTNPKEFIDSLLNIPKTLLEVIPNILLSLVDFLTFGFFNGAVETIQNGLKNLFGVKDESKPQGTEEIKGDSTTGNAVKEGVQKFNPIAQAGEAVKGAASAVLNPIGTIGNLIGGLFGGKKDEGQKPQLKEGGVVGPTKGGSGVSVEPLDKIAETSGILSTIKKTSKMFMDLLTMPFRLVGAALIALTVNTIGKIPGVGPFINPLLESIVSKFDLPSSIANMVMGKKPQDEKTKKEDKPTKPNQASSGSKSTEKPKTDGVMPGSGDLYTMLTGKESPTAETTGSPGSGQATPGGGTPGSTPAGSLSFEQLKTYAKSAGFSDADATRMAAIAMAESSGNPKAHNSKPPDNSYGLWQINMIGELGPARRKQLGISSNEQLFDPAVNAKAAKMIKDSQGWNAWTVHKTGAYQKFMPSKKDGGWITGPQSGYPVSLDGGLSTAFIGHGTEWVGFKKAAGGAVSSAFVIPFDTPSTRSNGGLVGRRMREAKSGGYALPYASGGVVKTDGVWDTGPGYTIKGTTDQQGRPVVFSQAAANAFAQMMSASGGKVRGSDVASSKRSPAKNKAVGGATGSKHMYGVAMDIHGSSGTWIRQNGAKYGWVANDYPGSHGGHFEFKGAGISPGDSKNQGNQDGTKPDTAGPGAPGAPAGGAGGADVMGSLRELYTILTGQPAAGGGGGGGSGIFGGLGGIVGGAFGGPVGSIIGNSIGGLIDGKSPLDSIASNFGNLATGGMNLGPVGSVLSNVPNYSSKFKSLQTENLVSTAFGSAGSSAMQVINASPKGTTSVQQTLDTASLGATLPKNGNWSIYKTNL